MFTPPTNLFPDLAENNDFDEAYVLAYDTALSMFKGLEKHNQGSMLDRVMGVENPQKTLLFSWSDWNDDLRDQYMKKTTDILMDYFGCASPASVAVKNRILKQALSEVQSPAQWVMAEIVEKKNIYIPELFDTPESFNKKSKNKEHTVSCLHAVHLLPLGLLPAFERASRDLKNYTRTLNRSIALTDQTDEQVVKSGVRPEEMGEEIVTVVHDEAEELEALIRASVQHQHAIRRPIASQASRVEDMWEYASSSPVPPALSAQKIHQHLQGGSSSSPEPLEKEKDPNQENVLSDKFSTDLEEVKDPLEEIKQRLILDREMYRHQSTHDSAIQATKKKATKSGRTFLPPLR